MNQGVSANRSFAEDSVVIGVDFGTLSGRAVVVRADNGAELGQKNLAFGLDARQDGGMKPGTQRVGVESRREQSGKRGRVRKKG